MIINNELSKIEHKKYHYDNLTVGFSAHFRERLMGRVDYNGIIEFIQGIDQFISNLAEKVFLGVSKEYRVYCKLIKAYIICKFDAFRKHVTFITIFPLQRGKLEIKNNSYQRLLSI